MKERYKELMKYDPFGSLEDRAMETMSASLKNAGRCKYVRVSANVFDQYDGRVYSYTLIREVKEIEDGNTD